MAGRDRRLSSVACLALAACAGLPYAPYPLDLASGLPPDAFPRCQDVLRHRYGSIAVADAAAFRLQTEWMPTAEPPGERRAAVFRTDDGGLAVVVELRRLSEPLFGVPRWTEPRGWSEAERELADWLQAALRD